MSTIQNGGVAWVEPSRKGGFGWGFNIQGGRKELLPLEEKHCTTRFDGTR
jgi:hypothetical protein